METVIAKFKVTEVTKFVGSIGRKNDEGRWTYNNGECERIKMSVVSSDKPENDAFAMYSPYGNMEMVVNNEALFGFFKLDKEYFFEIKQA